MPRGDRTGPMGSGPMTGRRMGLCADSASPGYGMGRGGGFGRGYNRGLGLGRWGGMPQAGYGRFGGYPITAEQEIETLAEQARILEDELNQLKQRQAELQKQKKND